MLLVSVAYGPYATDTSNIKKQTLTKGSSSEYGAAICKTRSYLSDLSMDPLIGLCFLMYVFVSLFKNIVCSKFLDPRFVYFSVYVCTLVH